MQYCTNAHYNWYSVAKWNWLKSFCREYLPIVHTQNGDWNGIYHHHHRPHHHHDHRHDHHHHRVHQDHHEDQRHDGVIAVIARRHWCGEATQPQPSPEYNHLHLCQCLRHCHHCNHHHHLCQFLRHHLHLRQRLGHQLHRLFNQCLCIHHVHECLRQLLLTWWYQSW